MFAGRLEEGTEGPSLPSLVRNYFRSVGASVPPSPPFCGDPSVVLVCCAPVHVCVCVCQVSCVSVCVCVCCPCRALVTLPTFLFPLPTFLFSSSCIFFLPHRFTPLRPHLHRLCPAHTTGAMDGHVAMRTDAVATNIAKRASAIKRSAVERVVLRPKVEGRIVKAARPSK